MPDKEILEWIHDRLELVHKEDRNLDYMHKLRAIIAATPNGRISNGKNMPVRKPRIYRFWCWLWWGHYPQPGGKEVKTCERCGRQQLGPD